MALFKYRRTLEVMVTPAVQQKDDPVWVEADQVELRVAGGHTVTVLTTKEGIELRYNAPKLKAAASVTSQVTPTGAVFRITP